MSPVRGWRRLMAWLDGLEWPLPTQAPAASGDEDCPYRREWVRRENDRALERVLPDPRPDVGRALGEGLLDGYRTRQRIEQLEYAVAGQVRRQCVGEALRRGTSPEIAGAAQRREAMNRQLMRSVAMDKTVKLKAMVLPGRLPVDVTVTVPAGYAVEGAVGGGFRVVLEKQAVLSKIEHAIASFDCQTGQKPDFVTIPRVDAMKLRGELFSLGLRPGAGDYTEVKPGESPQDASDRAWRSLIEAGEVEYRGAKVVLGPGYGAGRLAPERG